MAFSYRNGSLWAGDPTKGSDLLKLAREQKGPIYVYDIGDIVTRVQALKKSFAANPHAIHYALKANANRTILKTLVKHGLGADTVSGGEVRDAAEAGFKPETIIFSGVGKTATEIEFAIQLGIKQINVESPQELERIGQIAKRLGKTAAVAFRMNPDVNPDTHPYITTGFRENKFGMDESFIPGLREILGRYSHELRLRGLTLHIGSQLLSLDTLSEAISKTIPVFKSLRQEYSTMDRFDIGGGLGIRYDSDDARSEFSMIEAYGQMAGKFLRSLGCEIMTEPGRILVARSGLLIGEIQYIKDTGHKVFAILNTGMNHLLRPALYQAKHRVLPLEERVSAKRTLYDIVGPICESSDFLAKAVSLPELNQGDFVAIADAGAYGFSMANRYNQHDLPVELTIDE